MLCFAVQRKPGEAVFRVSFFIDGGGRRVEAGDGLKLRAVENMNFHFGEIVLVPAFAAMWIGQDLLLDTGARSKSYLGGFGRRSENSSTR